MAITQKHKVEFMVTSVLPTEAEEDIAQGLVKLAKVVMAGDTHFQGRPITHQQMHMLKLFASEGMEGVTDFLIRHTMREAIKEIRNDTKDLFKISPASARKVSR